MVYQLLQKQTFSPHFRTLNGSFYSIFFKGHEIYAGLISCSIDQEEGAVHPWRKVGTVTDEEFRIQGNEIEDLKKIIGDQSLVIDAFNKRSKEQNEGT